MDDTDRILKQADEDTIALQREEINQLRAERDEAQDELQEAEAGWRDAVEDTAKAQAERDSAIERAEKAEGSAKLNHEAWTKALAERDEARRDAKRAVTEEMALRARVEELEESRRHYEVEVAVEADKREARIAGLEKPIGNLLAVVHGDGGQHLVAVGVEKACAEAERIYCELRGRLRELEGALRVAATMCDCGGDNICEAHLEAFRVGNIDYVGCPPTRGDAQKAARAALDGEG